MCLRAPPIISRVGTDTQSWVNTFFDLNFATATLENIANLSGGIYTGFHKIRGGRQRYPDSAVSSPGAIKRNTGRYRGLLLWRT